MKEQELIEKVINYLMKSNSVYVENSIGLYRNQRKLYYC